MIHSGGVLADATLANQTLAGIRTAFAPKDSSALLWERVVGAQPGTMHVTFSSVAALLGSPGQANYSAANAALDAMASGWQARGLVGLSVQWGAWAEGGMAAANAATAKAVERMGMGMITPAAGIAAVHSLLMTQPAHTPALVTAVPFHWPHFMARLGSTPPMFAEFAAQAAAEKAADLAKTRAAAGLGGRAKAASAPAVSAEAQRAFVLGQVQDAVASVLGAPVGLDDPLMAAGLDSLGTGALDAAGSLGCPGSVLILLPAVVLGTAM